MLLQVLRRFTLIIRNRASRSSYKVLFIFSVCLELNHDLVLPGFKTHRSIK